MEQTIIRMDTSTKPWPGLFVTFEGNEGSSKSTQIRLLADWLTGQGQRVRVFREPGGTQLGEKIRHLLKFDPEVNNMDPISELLLFNASRAELVRKIIRPALTAGDVILCDRFFDSTIAYQGFGRNLDRVLTRATINVAVGDTQPDLTLVLRVSQEVSEKRKAARNATDASGVLDRFDAEASAFFARVEAGYEEIARQEPARVHFVDANGPIEEIQGDLRQRIQQALVAKEVRIQG